MKFKRVIVSFTERNKEQQQKRSQAPCENYKTSLVFFTCMVIERTFDWATRPLIVI